MDFLYSQLFVTPAYPTTSCAGQTIIVTGSNVGLGKEAARHFARLGAAKIILAVRNQKAGEAAKEDIVATTRCSADAIEIWSLDLLSYDSCRSFADRASKLPRIDVLLENAAIVTGNWVLTDKHENTIKVNVIGTFYLALLMLPKLKAVAKEFSITPRLTIVSSEVHAWTKLPELKEPNTFDALSDKSKSGLSDRYPTSKLLEVLVVRHLAPKLEGSGVIINMLNPGLCHSELAREGGIMLRIMKFFFARTTEVGSRTLVAAALAGPESHGKYMSDGHVDENSLSFSYEVQRARRLVQRSGENSARFWNRFSLVSRAMSEGKKGWHSGVRMVAATLRVDKVAGYEQVFDRENGTTRGFGCGNDWLMWSDKISLYD